MKEQERADRLARAIEEMIQSGTPPALDDAELNDLLLLARLCLDTAREAARASAPYEQSVWKRILSRIRKGGEQEKRGENGDAGKEPPQAQPSAKRQEGDEMSIQELQSIVAIRREMAENAMALAAAHRDSVWLQVQSRIQARSERGGLLGWPLRRTSPQAVAFAEHIDRIINEEPTEPAGDPELAQLVRLAHMRRVMAQQAMTLAKDRRGRIWARLRPRLMARQMMGQRRRSPFYAPRQAWLKPVAAGAAALLLVVALAPLPVTGLENHPVGSLVHLVQQGFGVTETAGPPTLIPPTEIVEGEEVTLEEAAERMGLPLRQPEMAPEGFTLVASRYFPKAVTARAGGTFMLAYQAVGTPDTPIILIYQEQASGDSIAVEDGAAYAFILPDGTIAIYVRGSWRPNGVQAVWGESTAQTVLFDRDGVRTIILQTGDHLISPQEMLAIAGSMVEPDSPSQGSP